MAGLNNIVSHFDLASITGDVFGLLQDVIPSTLMATAHSSTRKMTTSPRVQSVFEMSPSTAVYTYPAIGLVWTLFVFLVWQYLHDSNVDNYYFWAHAGIYGQLTIFWILVLAAPRSKGARASFFISSAISTVGPYGIFYLICFWYSYDTIIYPKDENGQLYTDVLNYIGWYAYAKVFLSFAGTAINTWLTYEMVKPIYDYWQILAVLEDTTPYVRPSED